VRRLSVCLVLTCLLAAGTFAAAPPGPPVQKLIDDLGDDDIDVRQSAEKKLAALGEDVLPALIRAQRSHEDADVRLRATLLVKTIERKVYGDKREGLEVRRFTGHRAGVIAFALSPDGKRMASAAGKPGRDFNPIVWDVQTGKELFRLKGHEAAVYGVAWAADGKRILTGGLDHKLILHDTKTGKSIRNFEAVDEVYHLAVTPDGKRAVSSGVGAVQTWDLDRRGQLATNGDALHVVRGVATTPDGKRFVSASFDGGVRLIDLETGKLVRQMKGGHGPDTAWAAAVSPDGKLIASTGEKGQVRLWDAATGKPVRELKRHVGVVHGAAFSRDGRRLITAGTDKTAIVWDVATGKVVQRLVGHQDIVTCAAFLPDGRHAVTSSYDRTLRLWTIRP
jgi:WD40 repeat protein